jgi:hypothetical protein
VRDNVILPTLNRLGWVRESSKGQWEPAQQIQVLGLGIDLVCGRYFVPEDKLKKAIRKCNKAAMRKSASRRWLAGVAGYVNSIALAVPLVRVYLRQLYCEIGKSNMWDVEISLTRKARKDLLLIGQQLKDWPLAPLWRPARLILIQSDASSYG